MLYKVQKYTEKLLNSIDYKKIIVGVSGGPDSVALLHILNKLGYDCIAAHCNFHLRMAESERDELFVRKLCDTFKIKLVCVDFDTKRYAKDNKLSIEMAARHLRYEWFEKIRAENNAEAIATGHHADDNAETMLLNLIRGTGIKGLSGIPPINGKIIRPLLTCTREEILKYLHVNSLTYITDSTNLQNDFTRNKIRNQVMPLLQDINPSIKQTISKSIKRFRELNSFYEQCVKEKIEEVVHKSENQTLINIEKLCLFSSPALILYEILYPMGFHPDVIEKVFENIHNDSGKLFYSENYRLLKDRNFLIITANKDKSNLEYNISHYEDAVFKPFKIKIERFERDKIQSLKTDKNTIFVDAEKVKLPLTIRNWQKGDVFYPFGMKGKKKLSDFFTDEKLSIIEKENIEVLISENEIIWIIGYRADDRFKVTEKTKIVIQFQIQE